MLLFQKLRLNVAAWFGQSRSCQSYLLRNLQIPLHPNDLRLTRLTIWDWSDAQKSYCAELSLLLDISPKIIVKRMIGVALVGLAIFALPSPVLAQSSSEAQIYGLAGPSTYKSSLLQNNDTSYSTAYGFGLTIWSEVHQIHMGLENESTQINFQLNNSRINLTEQDVELTYQWYGLYFGPLFTRANWSAKAPPDADSDGYLDFDAESKDYLKTSVTGIGANLGVTLMPVSSVLFNLDARYSVGKHVDQSLPAVPEPVGIKGTEPVLGRQVKMGPRLIATGLVSADIYQRSISVLAGYRFRRYSITIEEEDFREIFSTSYVGLRFTLRFGAE